MSISPWLSAASLYLIPLSTLVTTAAPAHGSDGANVLLVIVDDMGVDSVGAYGSIRGAVRTPELDRLAASGVRFDAVWSSPACSPTRATILTGKYGFRTGIGSVIRHVDGGEGLSAEHVALPAYLRDAAPDVRTACFGKWHLSGDREDLGHPTRAGFEVFRGTVGNLGSRRGDSSYFAFDGIHDGQPERRDVYATTAVTDDAIAAMERWKGEDWLVVASYHAAHLPLHEPPPELLSEETRAKGIEGDRATYLAMVEALDHEIGRLVSGIPTEARDRTLVLIVGDNGTDADVAETRPGKNSGSGRGKRATGKGTLLQSGIHVPLIAFGQPVKAPGRVSTELVHTVDLFATAAHFLLGEFRAPSRDSVSFLPVLMAPGSNAAREGARSWLFSERFELSAERQVSIDRVAIRGSRFKLIEDRERESLRLFDLLADPEERVNLLRHGKMDAGAISALARFTVLLAGPFGDERDRALLTHSDG